MIPVYIFYSMFGFQRTADGLWAAADQMARGFLLGATAGRTTLNGEGLQHEDGHSLLIAATNPAVVAYDPAFGVRDRLHHRERAAPDVRREAGGHLLLPDRLQRADPPAGRAGGRGRRRPAQGPLPVRAGAGRRRRAAPQAQILASGTGMQWALKAQQLLAQDWGVAADVWSATSWTELRRDAVETEEWNLLHPDQTPRVPYVTQALRETDGPGRRGLRLHAGGAGPDLALGAGRLHLAGHRRLRPVRHPARAAPPLPRRRRDDRGGHAAPARPRGEVPTQVAADAARKYAIDDVTAAPVGETGGDT